MQLVLASQTMINKYKKDDFKKKNDICEECNKKDKSVTQNFILISLKVCNYCRLSKNIFPV